MPITLGAYTAWQEKTLDIEVVLKKGDNSRILKPTQECFPDEDAASASVNMRTLQIIFPKGMEMHQSEQVYLYVTMTWLIDYQIKDVDIYFTDPENYGSYAEIAERLHIKEVSCRSRLVRAKAHFAELQQKEKIL
ncbi:MAG TPA: sigma-70 region 4 domain-containing protein [Clostridiales bacterium]|nr:sigma-70 region 4 domain-containing protein [Clostridiales bacterium]